MRCWGIYLVVKNGQKVNKIGDYPISQPELKGSEN